LTTTETGFTGGGVLLTLLAIMAITAVIVLVTVFRERHHRKRRAALETQLTSLEGVLVGLAAPSSDEPAAEELDPTSGAFQSADSFSPRGPLSTAISILQNGLRPNLPAPDRVDLRATCHIYEHLQRPLTPADLADGLNLSLRSLQRGLSGTLGCTPRELILAIKMREAKRCLIEDDARVQEAARAVGFDDPFHFSRRFKAYYRVSPTEMQDRINRNVA
jgi:AraC-like DNA-binding protein